MAARAAGRRLVLISDAAAAAGAPPGTYRLGWLTIVSDGRRALAGGRLAGSAVGIDRGPVTLVAQGIRRAAAPGGRHPGPAPAARPAAAGLGPESPPTSWCSTPTWCPG